MFQEQFDGVKASRATRSMNFKPKNHAAMDPIMGKGHVHQQKSKAKERNEVRRKINDELFGEEE